MFNKASTTPLCHAVVHFELTMSYFEPLVRMIVLNGHERLPSKPFFFHGYFQCVKQG